jgi:hypothetical protein
LRDDKERLMPILIFCMLLFILLGILWLIGAGLLFGALLGKTGAGVGSALDYHGKNCACRFPFRGHTTS